MKKCISCGLHLRMEDFYKHPQMADGRLGKCKECHKRDIAANRKAKADYYLEYDRQRADLPHRVEARANYAATPRGKERMDAGGKAWKARNPTKRECHNIVGNAVRDGRLTKDPCEVCGFSDAEAHHDDYSKPLSVRWLCKKHHADHHKAEREQQRELQRAEKMKLAA